MNVCSNIVAHATGTSESIRNCAHCKYHSEFISDMLWCIGWSKRVNAADSCSMFVSGDVIDAKTEASS